MTSLANNLNGIASGTTVTTANSGGVSGNAFNIVLVPTGGSNTAQSAAAYEGATGLQLVFPAANTSGHVNWTIAAAAGVRLAVSFYVRFGSVATAVERLATLQSTFVVLSTTGQVQVFDSASATIARASTAAITPGTWLYVEVASTVGTTTSNGRSELNVYTASTGATLLSYDSGATANTGTTAISSIYIGRSANATSANTVSYDLLTASNVLTNGFPGTRPVVTSTGGMKVWTGSAWAVKPVKVWTGSAWVAKPVKRWNGTSWVTLP